MDLRHLLEDIGDASAGAIAALAEPREAHAFLNAILSRWGAMLDDDPGRRRGTR